MASSHRAPKQWCLSKVETVNSFENWKQNLLYSLSLDNNFTLFMTDGAIWDKRTKANPLRGFTDDNEDVPVAQRRTAQQKVNTLELMLGQIANYCPIISRNTLVKNSTSLEFIWQSIRQHFGFQVTGAHLIDFVDIALEPDERPEDLFQRLMAFVEDILLRTNGISHHGNKMTEDEELTPTLENMVVLIWLKLIHPELPRLIKQRYGTELRSRTLASIKPEISQALSSLLDEIRSSDDARVMRTAPSSLRRSMGSKAPYRTATRFPRQGKSCPLCKQAGRSDYTHFLSECSFLPLQDKQYIAKARQIIGILDEDSPIVDYVNTECTEPLDSDTGDHKSCDNPTAFRVQTRLSPYIDTFYGHHPIRITIDSGATGNMIRHSVVKRLGCRMTPSAQSAHQADGSSPLQVVGEVHISFTRESQKFMFEGLVVENLDVDVLAGTPFMEVNDVSVRPAKRHVTLGDGTNYMYGSGTQCPGTTAARRALVLRAPATTTIVWPGEFVEVELPIDSPPDSEYALEPRTDAPSVRLSKASEVWPPPSIVSSVAGRIRIPNLSSEPHSLKRNEHFCQVSPVFIPEETGLASDSSKVKSYAGQHASSSASKYARSVSLDPDNLLPEETRAKFVTLLDEYDKVFDPDITGYNGAVGPFEAKVNMGPVEPPQRKGRLPQYARHKLVELQEKFDQLEDVGVFKRPEEIGISVEYLNPSFLVKKASGGSRLVTAFSDIGRYSKPQPSLMPDVDSTLRQIAQWKHIIATDLTKAFYQIPLARNSMKYCGVATPFKGVRVYVRSAMGMPGSETALEELMCRVLGHLLQEGFVAKIADDLYCGGGTPEELLKNWKKVLHVLYQCNLRLSASKTVINPKTTTILGWIWSLGTLRASSHRIATLASCPDPQTVGCLRSFIGAYKVLILT